MSTKLKLTEEGEYTLLYLIFKLIERLDSPFLMKKSFLCIDPDAANIIPNCSDDELKAQFYYLKIHYFSADFGPDELPTKFSYSYAKKQFKRIQECFESDPLLMSQLFSIDIISEGTYNLSNGRDDLSNGRESFGQPLSVDQLLVATRRMRVHSYITEDVIDIFRNLQQTLSGDYVLK
jgi:hypothetical protein